MNIQEHDKILILSQQTSNRNHNIITQSSGCRISSRHGNRLTSVLDLCSVIDMGPKLFLIYITGIHTGQFSNAFVMSDAVWWQAAVARCPN